MDDFRIPGSSFFDERPEVKSSDEKKRKRPHKPGEPPPEPEDEVELTPENEGPPEEGGDYYTPSGGPEEE